MSIVEFKEFMCVCCAQTTLSRGCNVEWWCLYSVHAFNINIDGGSIDAIWRYDVIIIGFV